MLIDSKNISQNILQKNQYIRGSFNLFSNKTIQNKTIFIQIEENEDNNNLNNTNYYLEFSSNFKDIKLIFNNDFNYSFAKPIKGATQYFISTKNLKKGKYNFTIQIDNTIKHSNNYFDNYFVLSQANYIIKFNKEINEENQEFILNKSCKCKKINDDIIYKPFSINYNYNCTVKNNKENIKFNNYCQYTYFIQMFLKYNLENPQLLNTTGFIYYTESFNDFNYEHITDDPNKDFSFIATLEPNKKYILSLFVKENCLKEENYYSTNDEINTKEDDDKYQKIIIILSISFGCAFIITIIISVVVCAKYSKKNKSLKEEITKISFGKGIDEEDNNENKKETSDSEITVI